MSIKYEIFKDKVPFTPQEAGYDPKRLDVLDAHIAKLLETNKIQAASYLLARDEKIFACNSVGKLSYSEDDMRPFMPDSIIRIASITKMFTGTAIMKLVEDGKLRLAQEIKEFIKEFDTEGFSSINIMHLLTHTSGICPDAAGSFNQYAKGPWWFIKNKDKDTSWIAAALSAGFRAKPGEEWAYSSFGYSILGEIITRVSGVHAHEYIMENIVKPLGMQDTFFDVQKEKCDRFLIDNEYVQKWIDEIKSGTEQEKGIWDQVPSTGGGIFSTLSDLAIFGHMLMNKGTYKGVRIIGRKAYEKMTQDYTGNTLNYGWGAKGERYPYGFGFEMRCGLDQLYTKGTIMHEGAGVSSLLIDPAERFVAVLFAPLKEFWKADVLFNTFAAMWSGIR